MFSKPFIAAKCLTVLVSFVALLVYPPSVPYLIAANILVTAPESILYHRAAATGLVAIALAAFAATQLRWNDTRLRFVLPFLAVYSVWNAAFYYQGCRQWIGAVSQVVVAVLPTLAVLLYGKAQKEWALWIFSLVRAAVLAVMCLYAAGQQICL